MNDKWTDDLEQKMKGHTEIGPEGLWEDLEQKLFGEEKGKIIPLWSDTVYQHKEEKPSSNIGFKRIIGVVASVVILLIGGMELYKQTGQVSPKEIIKEKESIVVDSREESLKENKEENKVEESTEENIKQEHIAMSPTAIASYGQPKKEGKTVEELHTGVSKVVAISQLKMKGHTLNDNTEIAVTSANIQEAVKDYIAQEEIRLDRMLVDNIDRKKEKRGFSIGLLSSNLSANSSQAQNGYASMKGGFKTEANDPVFSLVHRPLSEIYSANLDRNVNTKIDHKRPVRFGLSVYYQMGDKWGINTGVTYSRLSSKLQSGSDEYKVISDQTLHYIGIPIQVNYNVWQIGRFSTYVNGGVHLEKAIAGTVDTTFKMGDVVEKGPKEHIHTKSLQASVNASLGMEYKLAKEVGVFFEPGVRYYFDDRSSLSNVYKERPFNFNAQIGIRYSIPNAKSRANNNEQSAVIK